MYNLHCEILNIACTIHNLQRTICIKKRTLHNRNSTINFSLALFENGKALLIIQIVPYMTEIVLQIIEIPLFQIPKVVFDQLSG